MRLRDRLRRWRQERRLVRHMQATADYPWCGDGHLHCGNMSCHCTPDSPLDRWRFRRAALARLRAGRVERSVLLDPSSQALLIAGCTLTIIVLGTVGSHVLRAVLP